MNIRLSKEIELKEEEGIFFSSTKVKILIKLSFYFIYKDIKTIFDLTDVK